MEETEIEDYFADYFAKLSHTLARCGNEWYALWDKDEGEVFLLNKIYEDYIREKVHEQLIGMAKRMLEDDILSLEKIAEYSGLELAEAENL